MVRLGGGPPQDRTLVLLPAGLPQVLLAVERHQAACTPLHPLTEGRGLSHSGAEVPGLAAPELPPLAPERGASGCVQQREAVPPKRAGLQLPRNPAETSGESGGRAGFLLQKQIASRPLGIRGQGQAVGTNQGRRMF